MSPLAVSEVARRRGESVNEFRRAARQKLFSCAVAVLLNFSAF